MCRHIQHDIHTPYELYCRDMFEIDKGTTPICHVFPCLNGQKMPINAPDSACILRAIWVSAAMYRAKWTGRRRLISDLRVNVRTIVSQVTPHRFVAPACAQLLRCCAATFFDSHHGWCSIFSVLQLAPPGKLYGRFHFQVFSSPPIRSYIVWCKYSQ